MLAVRLAGVLAAAIRMVEQPAGGPSLMQRHAQGVQRQARFQAFAHRPTHEPAAAEIEHARQIQPAFLGGHVGDVSRPHFVGSLDRCLSLPESVGRDGLLVVAVRGPWSAAAPLAASQTPPTHEPRDPVATAGMARPPQRPMQARTAVGASAAREERADLFAQGGIGAVPHARLALTPGVEAGP